LIADLRFADHIIEANQCGVDKKQCFFLANLLIYDLRIGKPKEISGFAIFELITTN
jgi:hypothetical protein